MPYQETFAVEDFIDKYEEDVEYNIGETCCYSMSLDDLELVTGEKFSFEADKRLTYGPIRGSTELRSLIAEIYSNEDIVLTKDNVLITNGAIGANFLTFYALVGPGDHVICVDPTSQQLHSVPHMFGAEVDLLHLRAEHKFIPDIDELKILIKDNTKCLVLNNPNNPLGSVVPTEKLMEIVALADKHNITILCDEVYSPLFHSCEKPKSLCQMSKRGIVTGSMSKSYCAAGVRLGWIVSQNKQFLEEAASRRDYNMISVSVVDDSISRYILRHRQAVLKRNFALCRENMLLLKDFIQSSNGKFSFVHDPQGGSVCLVRINGINDTHEFASKLAEEFKVLCAPGECFGIPNTIRIGYANSQRDLVHGLRLLELAYDKLISQ